MTGVLDNEVLLASLREPRRNRLSFFYNALQEHRGHATFRTQDWVYSRELGFTCACSGTEQEWRISLSSLREMVPEARATFNRMRSHFCGAGRKKLKRKQRRAQRKARALLHSCLTKEQRWDLRASKSFEVIGQDGYAYQVIEGSCNNVRRIEPSGSIRWSLCLVTTEFGLPIYDLMLMQKLLLETDVELFLKTAHAQDRRTGNVYNSGEFLLKGEGPPEQGDTGERPVHLDVSDEVLDNPEPWVREQLEAVP